MRTESCSQDPVLAAEEIISVSARRAEAKEVLDKISVRDSQFSEVFTAETHFLQRVKTVPVTVAVNLNLLSTKTGKASSSFFFFNK